MKRIKDITRRCKTGLKNAIRSTTSKWRTLPDFIIIGVQKGGTSSLFHYLSQHPEVVPSRKKEVHYYDNHFGKGLAWYKSHFGYGQDGKISGEASPYYVFHPLVPERLKKDNPKVKLILLLRNPVQRAYSQYNHNKRKFEREELDFLKALKNEESRLHGSVEKLSKRNGSSDAHRYFSYQNRSFYGRQIKKWLTHFPREQFLFLKSEDFFSDPRTILKEVYEFLSISENYPADLSPRNVGRYNEFNEETREYLKEIFSDDIAQLRQLLGPAFDWTI